MELSRSELIDLACALFWQMNSPHIPEDSEHYRVLKKLYTKLLKEIDHAESN